MDDVPTKTEEIQEKTEEKPINKKSAAWTPERRKKQQLNMLKIIAKGKAYKGKKGIEGEPESIINTVDEVMQDTPAPAPTHKGNSFLTQALIFGLVIIFGIIFFLKTGTIKIDKNED